MDQRVCASCLNEFTPSSRHRFCPKCRAERNHDPCQCGQLKTLRAAMCASCSAISKRGVGNGNWKGGKTKHKAGYVMVYAPGHPRATTGNYNYVFEHILIMEEHLGRHLYPDETVHHKYGVRDDNRIEQLELWVKPQPTGIRAEDAVIWAKEILRRYPELVP